MADATVPPAEFRRAVAALNAMHPRPELFVSALDAPPRLAPFTWAFSVEADAGRPASEDLDEPDTSGRLILLHDPAGQDAWEGTFRLVCFVQARLEREQLGDEMLPVVAWSWLTEALSTTTLRTRPWAAPSPRRRPCGSATSPGPPATTT